MMVQNVDLSNVSIVLKQPRYPENIGAAARAMRNMGFTRLIVVDPENYDLQKIRKMAIHVSDDIVNNIKVYKDLSEALASYQFIVGSTARLGKHRMAAVTPSEMAGKLSSIYENNRVAILFGPEDRGLSNDDVRYCHALVNIPTSDFSSLNLAQAVMVICYEIFLAGRKRSVDFSPRLANRHELEGMYGQLKDILIKISFLNPENPDYWMNNFRRFFNRLPLRAKEVSIIRGVCRQINWYGEKKFNDGLKKK